MKKSKYIYFDKLNIKSKNKENIDLNIDNYGGISYNKIECLKLMKEKVDSVIDEDHNCTIDTFLDYYDFNYEIFIISRDHIEFDDFNEQKDYAYKNAKKVSKNNIYNFLVSIADFAIEKYDHNGNLEYGFIDLGFDEIYMSEKDEGLNIPLFKEGDIVELKNYPGKRYKIIHSNETNFMSPGNRFPLHYNGVVFAVEEFNKYFNEDEELENSITFARSEIFKINKD